MALTNGTHGYFTDCVVISKTEYEKLVTHSALLIKLRGIFIDEITEIDAVTSIDQGA